MLWKNIVLNVKTKNNFCTHVNLYFSWNSMNNLLSYCGLTNLRMRASDTDLPVILDPDLQNICEHSDSWFQNWLLDPVGNNKIISDSIIVT